MSEILIPACYLGTTTQILTAAFRAKVRMKQICEENFSKPCFCRTQSAGFKKKKKKHNEPTLKKFVLADPPCPPDLRKPVLWTWRWCTVTVHSDLGQSVTIITYALGANGAELQLQPGQMHCGLSPCSLSSLPSISSLHPIASLLQFFFTITFMQQINRSANIPAISLLAVWTVPVMSCVSVWPLWGNFIAPVCFTAVSLQSIAAIFHSCNVRWNSHLSVTYLLVSPDPPNDRWASLGPFSL